MKKYLFIVLLVGVCFGQAPDTLTLNDGTIIQGSFIKKGEFFTEFKNWEENEVSEIRNHKINRIVLSAGEVIFEREMPKLVVKTASENFEMAGRHLQNSLIRYLYSSVFLTAATYLSLEAIRDNKPTLLIPIFHAASIYNSIYGTLEIYRCGEDLINASKKIREIEKNLNIQIED